MRTSVGLLVLLALGLAGCGGQASSAAEFEGEQARVAEAIEEVQTAGERRDPAKLCRDLLTKALRDKVAADGSSCDKEVEKAIEDADAFELEVTEIEITGTTATATTKGEAGDDDITREIALVKEQDRWRVDSFSGS